MLHDAQLNAQRAKDNFFHKAKERENKFITNALTLNEVTNKPYGSSPGCIVNLHNCNNYEQGDTKVMIKSMPVLNNGMKAPKNFLNYEVAISDLMGRLGLRSVKNMLISNIFDKKDCQFVASEWKHNLLPRTSLAYKPYQKIHALLETDGGYPETLINTALNAYKRANCQHIKEFLKMYICLNACGMTDTKVGSNIMMDTEGHFVTVDNGFSDFTRRGKEGIKDWNEVIDLLEKDSDPEVQEWGKQINAYKNYALEHIENIKEQQKQFTKRFNNEHKKGLSSMCK